MSENSNIVFGLDIGTRNVVGTVGYRDDDEVFHVVDQYSKAHTSRAMLDGQIHDITAVGKTIMQVKDILENSTGETLRDVCIAAAGRVLKTITTSVEIIFDEETVVTSEHIHTLDLLGVDKAQGILNANNDTKFRFYSVGYSTIHYYANDDLMSNLVGHKVKKISEDIIVTFLPEDVVDGLYMAVGLAGMQVENMTLEPIAAINIAIPKQFRMLNIALVDVGAGTSDISITKDGTIIAYGMIPKAGDELTEVLVQTYLVDFDTAEQMKIDSGVKDTVEFEDILKIPHKLPAAELLMTMMPILSDMAQDIGKQIIAMNGGNTVSAVFVVGGGGRVKGFTERLAKILELPEERVALRGEEVLGKIEFDKDDMKVSSLLVTPIGICLSAYEQKNNFIFVHFNGERLKLYDNDHLTIVDAVVQSGFPNEDLFPKTGKELRFVLDGKTRLIRGGAGEPSAITLNGSPASLGDALEPNCDIKITPSTTGAPAQCMIRDIDEYKKEDLSFMVNGKMVVCPKFARVNGDLVTEYYEIKNDDRIELLDHYTIAQLIEFMDVEVDMNEEILVNGRDAVMDTEVYENFSIEWTVLSFLSTQEEGEKITKKPKMEKMEEEDELPEDDPLRAIRPGRPSKPDEKLSIFADDINALKKKSEKPPEGISMEVIVNERPLQLTGKAEYIFVDVFDIINFDTSAGHGRSIVTRINGQNAQYTQLLKPGDRIEIRWEEE